MSVPNALKEFIIRVPKLELHVHLEGTLEPEMMLRLARKNNISLPYSSLQDVVNAYDTLTNLNQFLELYYLGCHVLRDESDFYELTRQYARRLQEQNVMHFEPFFDPQAHISRGVPLEAVVSGITAALRDAAKDDGITSSLTMCIVRDRPVEEAVTVLEACRDYFADGSISGVGLDSDEIGHPPSQFSAALCMARDRFGVRVVAHGGHDGPPHPYVSELLELSVSRIDHGVRIVEDAELVQVARARRVPFTVCPISNVRIGPYETMAAHPIRAMVEDHGLTVCINSDDPAYLRATLSDNFVAVCEEFRWGEAMVAKLLHNAVEMSTCGPDRKSELHMAIDSALQFEEH